MTSAILTDQQRLRYARLLALDGVGEQGLEALLDSHVAIIGVGGLGALLAAELSASGVGKLTIIESDRVALSNLHRQIPYNIKNVGQAKTEALQGFIQKRNPDCELIIHNKRLTDSNAHALLQGADIIADSCDNFETRFAVNRAGFDLQVPLVSASVIQWQGQVSTFTAYKGDGYPCYQCFCPDIPPEDYRPSCSSSGVMGSVAAIMASLQATEIIKELLHFGEGLSGKIIRYDARKTRFATSILKKRGDCPVCQ